MWRLRALWRTEKVADWRTAHLQLNLILVITNEKLLMGFNTDSALEQRAEELQRDSNSDNEFLLYGGGQNSFQENNQFSPGR